MSRLTFTSMPRPFPDMAMWSADNGIYSFIVTKDPEGIIASAKLLAGPRKPFTGERIDLGRFNSIGAAMAACQKFSDNGRL